MTKKSISIDFEYDYDFLLIGICSPLKDYHLCYWINKELSTTLTRCETDIAMNFPDGLEKAYFPLFEFMDKQYQNQWYLLGNKCPILCSDQEQNQGTIFDGFIQDRKKTKYLIPENSRVDFYLQIHGIIHEDSKQDLLQNIKKIDRIVSAHEINIDELRSKENLII